MQTQALSYELYCRPARCSASQALLRYGRGSSGAASRYNSFGSYVKVLLNNSMNRACRVSVT